MTGNGEVSAEEPGPQTQRRYSFPGNGRVQKQINYPKLVPDSSSQSSDTTAEDLSKYHSGWRFADKALGTPIKFLLAKELSREAVSRKRYPGLIARLMGLDGLPPPLSSQKQQRRSSKNYMQSIVSTEKATSSSSQSSRKSSKAEKEFKDVFEVLDMSKLDSRNYSSPGSANSELTETEMAFIQRKFMNAKRLSTDAKLQDSKEFDEVIEDLDSDKDHLSRILDQPNSLFSKHLHDLQGVSFPSHCGHLSARQSYVPQLGSSGLGCKAERETAYRSRRKPNVDPFNLTCAKHAALSQLKSSKLQLEEKDETTILPTRIVILKPNLGSLQNASRNESSPHPSYDFLSDCGNDTGLSGIKKREPDLSAPKRFPVTDGLSRYKSKESREIAKQITTQMRNGFHGGSVTVSASKSKGYAGDESSCYWSENESAYESDVRPQTSRNPIEWSNRYRSSSSRSTVSSVNRETKKRLSERWKMTHKSIDMGVVSEGSTLGEMLAIPHREMRPASSEATAGGKRFSQNLNSFNGPAGWVEPLGISRGDGRQSESIRNLPRLRSLPSLTTINSPIEGRHYDTPSNGRYLMPKEVFQQERNKSVKPNFSQKDGPSFRTSRCRSQKSHISHVVCGEIGDISPEIHFSDNQKQHDITEDDPVKQYQVATDMPANIIMDSGLASKSVVNVIENAAAPSEPEFLTSTPAKADSFSATLDALRSQEEKDAPPEGLIAIEEPMADVESSVISKEANQPSPVSVLEAPFPHDPSSGSECFGSLGADLHGLWMQLQLLKLEAEAYAEGPMLVSSDEESEDASVGFSDERGTAEESREFSYIDELLVNSGINDADLDTYMDTCHSLECPVNPNVFEKLEKYGDHGSWPRSDRKLLFDIMNSALLVIHQKFTDPHPWVRRTSNIGCKWIKNGLRDGLHKLLEKQNTKGGTPDEVLSSEPEWLNVEEDIDVIGREIERLLTEELVTEATLL